MTGFARLIVVFCIFIRLTFSMEDSGNTTANSLNDNSFSVVSNRKIVFKGNIETKFFKQNVDHFDEGNNLETWDQKYYVVDEFSKKNKKQPPVFFMIGGRRHIKSEDITNGIWIQWAKKFQALCFLAEHRFFGNNLVANGTSTENLREYLNIELAVADFVHFIKTMKRKWHLTSENKWILFGGEYAATLAAMIHIDNPGLVNGVVASSAYFPTDYFLPGYYDIVGNFVKKLGPGNLGLLCYHNINLALVTLSRRFDVVNEDSCQWIKLAFVLNMDFNCTNPFLVSLLFEQIATKVSILVKNEGRLRSFCDSFTSDKRHMKVHELIEGFASNGIRINTDNEMFVDRLKEAILNPNNNDRQFFYHKCTELGGYPVTETDNQPFIFRFNREFMFTFYCTQTFGLDYSNIKTTFFNFNKYRYRYYRNTIFIDGNLDLLWESRMSKYNPNNNKVITIEGADLCEDMKAHDSPTPPHIKKAQKKIKQLIDKWINE